MFNFSIFQPFIISLVLGAFLGIERAFAFKVGNEKSSDDLLGGIRTFSLIALLGTISAFIDEKHYPGVMLLSFAGIILLTAISYFISFYKKDERGITTELSLLICFIIGVLVQKEQYILSIFITVLVVMILYFKEYLNKITGKIESEDISAVIKFSIISFVILPVFDPDKAIYIKDFASEWLGKYPEILKIEFINPYTVWLMVVLISGIGFTGYIAIKILGSQKGIGLTGFLGGLVSSTATTVTFSKRSREDKALSLSFVLAIILACSTMFPRILVEVLIINYKLLNSLSITMGFMAMGGFAYALYLWFKTGKEKSDEVPLKNPFNIMPAVKFGLLYAVIVLITKLVGEIAGDSGLYIVSVLSGLTDVDAITLTMSQLSKTNPEKLNQATIAITLAAFSNTIMKAGMAATLGSKEFRKPILIGFSIIIISGGVGLLVFSLIS